MAEERKPMALIVEDDDVWVELLTEITESEGYVPIGIVGRDIKIILNKLEGGLKKFSPDVAIVDGLRGNYPEVLRMIKMTSPNTACIVYSAEPHYVEIAEKEGHAGLVKGQFGSLRKFLQSCTVQKSQITPES